MKNKRKPWHDIYFRVNKVANAVKIYRNCINLQSHKYDVWRTVKRVLFKNWIVSEDLVHIYKVNVLQK